MDLKISSHTNEMNGLPWAIDPQKSVEAKKLNLISLS